MISAIAGRRPAEAEQATRQHLRSVITALNATRDEDR
jgi:DNA-binding FadR family transcriptional regulator